MVVRLDNQIEYENPDIAYVVLIAMSSLSDMEMLSRADRGVVVVGDEMSRSKRMDLALGLAIHDGLLKASQAVLATGASPRLDTGILPPVSVADSKSTVRFCWLFSTRP